MSPWVVTDDAVSIRTGIKELGVCSVGAPLNWIHIVERTHYTGQFSQKGRRLAKRLEKLLCEIERHSAKTEQP
jgi:hypothetical protein